MLESLAYNPIFVFVYMSAGLNDADYFAVDGIVE